MDAKACTVVQVHKKSMNQNNPSKFQWTRSPWEELWINNSSLEYIRAEKKNGMLPWANRPNVGECGHPDSWSKICRAIPSPQGIETSNDLARAQKTCNFHWGQIQLWRCYVSKFTIDLNLFQECLPDIKYWRIEKWNKFRITQNILKTCKKTLSPILLMDRILHQLIVPSWLKPDDFKPSNLPTGIPFWQLQRPFQECRWPRVSVGKLVAPPAHLDFWYSN